MSDQYFIVKKEVVPEIYSKVVEVKKLLRSGIAHSINEAAKIVGISRGAYYKYKDSVFMESELDKKSITTISLTLNHSPGVLSRLLNTIAEQRANVLTINQNIPIHDIANVTISLQAATPEMDLDTLINTINDLDGVVEVIILAKQ
jgi:chorismate mutase